MLAVTAQIMSPHVSAHELRRWVRLHGIVHSLVSSAWQRAHTSHLARLLCLLLRHVAQLLEDRWGVLDALEARPDGHRLPNC